MKYCAFDVDGVLLDVSERFRIAKELVESGRERDFWRVFFREELLLLDKPRGISIELINSRVGRYGLIVITGRPANLYKITLEQIVQNFKLRPTKIFMRRVNDYRPSTIVKLELIEKALNEGYEVVEYHDDDLQVLKTIKKLYPGITLYFHQGDSYRILS